MGTVVRRQPAVGVTYAPKRAPSPLHRSVLSSDQRTEIYLCMRSSSQVSFSTWATAVEYRVLTKKTLSSGNPDCQLFLVNAKADFQLLFLKTKSEC